MGQWSRPGCITFDWLPRLAAGTDWQPDAASQAAYASIVAGRTLDAAMLTEHAVNWSIPRPWWVRPADVPLVDDPFLAPIALEYTPRAAAAPVPLALSAIERMARRLLAAGVRP